LLFQYLIEATGCCIGIGSRRNLLIDATVYLVIAERGPHDRCPPTHRTCCLPQLQLRRACTTSSRPTGASLPTYAAGQKRSSERSNAADSQCSALLQSQACHRTANFKIAWMTGALSPHHQK
jgi:hypothetical protein